jgi:hypothetical protein
MSRSRTNLRTRTIGQVALRPAAHGGHGLEAWSFRAASEHPFDLGGSAPRCAGEDPELFWPATEAHADRARAVCRTCPVAVACLAVARERREWGVWGGELLARGRPTKDLPGIVRPSAHDTARSA